MINTVIACRFYIQFYNLFLYIKLLKGQRHADVLYSHTYDHKRSVLDQSALRANLFVILNK